MQHVSWQKDIRKIEANQLFMNLLVVHLWNFPYECLVSHVSHAGHERVIKVMENIQKIA